MNARVKKQGVSETGNAGATPAAAIRMEMSRWYPAGVHAWLNACRRAAIIVERDS